MNQLTYFPSVDDRIRLLALRKEFGIKSMADFDRRHLHAYDYAWRRVFLDEIKPASPIDPDGKWFDRPLAAKAEQLWRREYNRPPPEPAAAYPTPEDIAHVADMCNKIRASLAAWSKRNDMAIGRKPEPASAADGDATLAALQRDMGLRATPSPVARGGDRDSASAGGADAAPALDQGAILRKMDRE